MITDKPQLAPDSHKGQGSQHCGNQFQVVSPHPSKLSNILGGLPVRRRGEGSSGCLACQEVRNTLHWRSQVAATQPGCQPAATQVCDVVLVPWTKPQAGLLEIAWHTSWSEHCILSAAAGGPAALR